MFDKYSNEIKKLDNFEKNSILSEKFLLFSKSNMKIYYALHNEIINNNEEEIKYIWQEYTVYNSVGDYVKSEFDDVQFKATGPFIKGKKFIRVTEKDNYCKEKIVSAKISYLKIEFMSGETVNFNKEMLNYVNSNVEVV